MMMHMFGASLLDSLHFFRLRGTFTNFCLALDCTQADYNTDVYPMRYTSVCPCGLLVHDELVVAIWAFLTLSHNLA